MLANTLNTNEIKNSSGTEQEFGRISQGERQTEFALLTEVPSCPHRLTIKHSETGTGTSRRRRSLIRFDKVVQGEIDTTQMVTVSAYAVVDIPVGNMALISEATNVLANLMSFLSTTGSGTTVLFDGSGNGAVTLLQGTL